MPTPPQENAIAYLLAQIAVLETTNAALRKQLYDTRLALIRIANAATDARRDIETTMNDTSNVTQSDPWPDDTTPTRAAPWLDGERR